MARKKKQSVSKLLSRALATSAAMTGKTGAVVQHGGSLESLLSKTATLVEQQLDKEPAAIRTIHHMACTGGTLFAKCIAAMPNTLVLNEVDPLSPLGQNNEKAFFTPTNLISLIRQGDQDTSPDVLINLFLEELELVSGKEAQVGRSLVLRDHSHGSFMTGDTIPERPTLHEILADRYIPRSVVTVRDPIDSYLSMNTQGWNQQFSPATFDEYCRRYMAFLDRHDGIEIIKYEDLVAAPRKVMQRICTILAVPYSPDFMSNFGYFRFSGDSGRGGDVIEPKPRRPVPDDIAEEIGSSKEYELLRSRLQYPALSPEA